MISQTTCAVVAVFSFVANTVAAIRHTYDTVGVALLVSAVLQVCAWIAVVDRMRKEEAITFARNLEIQNLREKLEKGNAND
jgi:hypothetical protein